MVKAFSEAWSVFSNALHATHTFAIDLIGIVVNIVDCRAIGFSVKQDSAHDQTAVVF